MLVYTGGTFDLFHAGHVQFLRKCHYYGDVVVGLNTDEFIKDYKGKSPIMTFAERYEVLRSCEYVSEVIPNLSGEDSKPTILSIKPNYVIVGDDWKTKDYSKQMGFDNDWLIANGISLIYVPYTKNLSTSIIKRRIHG